MSRALLAALVAAIVLPAAAPAARYAVGARTVSDLPELQAALFARGVERVESLAPLPALVVEGPPGSVFGTPGAVYVERLRTRRLAGWTPNDPLAPRQWYLAQNRAFGAWEARPPLARVRVAVIDSGIDGGHPELAARIAAARSFVGGSPMVDKHGHGTFVAGVIAAESDNALGIAGMAPEAELVVAKVVASDGTIPVEAEARAIRWAVAAHARVINMSLGGVRDPLQPDRDTFSSLEAAAIRYAVSHGVLVVAAVGNADQAPAVPWRYASYPAALPHVLGVSALAQNGSSPPFSNRDAVYNDLAAPGEGILSTFPRGLTAERPTCAVQGYSDCGPEEYRAAEGTSFAAPQVSAAAAVLLGTRPGLAAEQVAALLERTAVDATAENGCRECAALRDAYTGWGRLDVTAAVQALEGPLPPRDRYEPNDDAGEQQATTLWGSIRRIEATLDYWDDQTDVYRVKLRRGQAVYASVRGPVRTDTNLLLWRPGTTDVDDLGKQDLRARQASRPGPRQQLGYRARKTGWFYVQVKLASPGSGGYRLTVVKT